MSFGDKAALFAAAGAIVILLQLAACNHPPPTSVGSAGLEISGTVTAAGKPSAAVELTLAGDRQGIATSDSTGKYVFRDLVTGLYSVTPAKTGFSFNPSGVQVELSSSSSSGKDFVMVQDAPMLLAGRSAIDFGTVKVGDSKTIQLSLSNLGRKDLTITGFQFTSPLFTTSQAALTVLQDSLVQIPLTFKPTGTAPAVGELTIASNDPASPQSKVTLTGRGVVAGAPLIKSDPTALDFGSVKIGSSVALKLTLSNTGSDLLHINSAQINSTDFSVTLPAQAIAFGRSLEIAVFFAPADTGKKSATLQIVSDATNSPNLSIPLSGTCFTNLPSNISVDPADVQFGTIFRDSLARKEITIRNSGRDSLIVTLVRVEGEGFSTNLSGSAIIGPGGTKKFDVRLQSGTLGSKRGSLTIFHSDPQRPELVVPLNGEVVNVPPQKIRLTPADSLVFATTDVGAQSVRQLWLVNPNSVTLSIWNFAVGDTSFRIQGDSLPVPPRDSIPVNVVFAPDRGGTIAATLTMQSNAVEKPTLTYALRGTGLKKTSGQLTLVVTRLDFSSTVAGGSRGADLALSNSGDGTLFINGVGTNSSQFVVESFTDTIPARTAGNIAVSFRPSAVGIITGKLLFNSSDPQNPAVTVELAGVGIDTTALVPLMTLSTRLVDLGTVVQNLTASTVITVGNLGRDTLRITRISFSHEEFGAQPPQLTVPPKTELALSISFTPKAPGEINGQMLIESNDQIRKQDTVGARGVGVDQSGNVTEKEVFIQGGSFVMGMAGEFEPVRQVTVRSFYMDAYEVTNQEFKEFIDGGGYDRPEYWTAEGWQWRLTYREQGFDPNNPRPRYWGTGQFPWESDPYSSRPGTPVVGVSWHEAYAYARFRGKSLPTEAQWEYSARGIEGRVYPWGYVWKPAFLNHGTVFSPYYDASDGYQYTAPVTLFPEGSTPQQVQNLAGNVWEWCLDWHGDYSLSDTFDPHGPAGGTEKVIRGGSWNGSVNYCRAFHRNKSDPNLRYKDGGIRLVRNF